MKLKAILFLALIASLPCFSGEIAFINNRTVVFTNTTASTNFNATGSITNTQTTIYTTTHAFQGFYTVTGSNAVNTSNIFDSTLDGTNWFPEQTNSWSTNGSFEYTFIGKRAAVRSRLYFITTNAFFTLNYVAQ